MVPRRAFFETFFENACVSDFASHFLFPFPKKLLPPKNVISCKSSFFLGKTMIFKVCRQHKKKRLQFLFRVFFGQENIKNHQKDEVLWTKMRRRTATAPKICEELRKKGFGGPGGRPKSIFGGFWESVGTLKWGKNGVRSLRSIDYRRVCDDVVRICACLAGLGVISARVDEEFTRFSTQE